MYRKNSLIITINMILLRWKSSEGVEMDKDKDKDADLKGVSSELWNEASLKGFDTVLFSIPFFLTHLMSTVLFTIFILYYY